MGLRDLAEDYLKRCRIRLKALDLFYSEESYADVVREAQEIFGLATKAMLLLVNISPPRIHDVSRIIIEELWLFPETIREEIKKKLKECRWLRKEREIAFYGDIDLIPGEEYTEEDAKKAIECAYSIVELLEKLFELQSE